MSHVDQKIKCVCGKEFVWTIGEQKFMETLQDRGLVQEIHAPRRCLECRAKRKR